MLAPCLYTHFPEAETEAYTRSITCLVRGRDLNQGSCHECSTRCLPFPAWHPCRSFGLSVVCEGSCGNSHRSLSLLLPLLPSLCSVVLIVTGRWVMTLCLPGHSLGLQWEFPCWRCVSGKSQLGEGPGAFQHSQGFRRHPSACSASSVLSWAIIPRTNSDSSRGLPWFCSCPSPPHAALQPWAAVTLTCLPSL